MAEGWEPELEIEGDSPAVEVVQKTNWPSQIVATFSLFVVIVQFSIYFSSLWPFMHSIDPSANQTFYGLALAAFSFGQMISSPIFGYLSTRFKTARPIIAVGIVFSILGNIIYIFTETVPVPSHRKWVILVARVCGGLGAGVVGMIRGYIAISSAPESKKRAITLGATAVSLGLTAGPAIQAAVTPIGYPAYIWGPIHFNQYTAPAFLSILGALIILAFLFTVFKENYMGVDTKKERDPYHYVPKYDMTAALLLIWCWFGLFFTITNSETVESPMTMAVFGWSSDDAVYYNSIIMTGSFSISFVGFFIFAVWGKKINERKSLFAGLALICSFYLVTYPWPFFPHNLYQITTEAPITQTTPIYWNSSMTTILTTTVDTSELGGCFREWCNYTPQLPLWLYLTAYPLLAVGLPFTQVPISTLFAQVLGPRRQGFMQSLMIMAGSFARLLGPILISWLFDNYGPRVAWTMTACVVSTAIVAAAVLSHRLVPLVMKPKLKSGQKLRYDGGRLYRF